MSFLDHLATRIEWQISLNYYVIILPILIINQHLIIGLTH